MNYTLEELNALNQSNAATPGKIAAVYDWENQEQEKFIYSVNEFNPQTQDLLITQIWTEEQEQVVRKKSAYVTTFLKTEVDYTGLAVQEIIRLYEMLDEWQTNTLDYAITTSD